MNYSFAQYLENKNLSKNTINSYTFSLRQFRRLYHNKFNRKTLRQSKMYLIENCSPKTINLRIRGVNCYLEFIHKEKFKLSTVKVQSKNFLENVISEADYEYFKKKFKQNNVFWYFVVRFLAATGARVSELIQIKAEHVQLGYLDMYSKGGKVRRLYIPSSCKKRH